jgi:hypothetical protein
MESDTGTIALIFIALAISVVSLVLSAGVFLRTGGRESLETIRRRQRLELDEVATSARGGLEDVLERVKRAQLQLAELRVAAADSLRRSIDELNQRLGVLRRKAESSLDAFRSEATAGALDTRRAIHERLRRIEANIEILRARAEINAAEALAVSNEFTGAEELLERAVARIREVKIRLSDAIGEDPLFTPLMTALNEAVHVVRRRASNHKQQIDNVLAASDSLIARLRAQEPATAQA